MQQYSYRKHLNILGFFFFTIVVLQSCSKETPPCYQPTETNINFNFVSRNIVHIDSIHDGKLIDTMIIKYTDTFLNNSRIYTYDLEQNFEIINRGGNMRISAPLDPSKDYINYVFQMDTSISVLDTISLKYETERSFISNACGFAFEYNINNIKSSKENIDSFILVKPKVKIENETHVQLYFY